MLVETALEPIFGQFYATDSLSVSTIQAYVFLFSSACNKLTCFGRPLTANITLFNDPESEFPTYLEVSTGNRFVTGDSISCFSTNILF